MSRSTTFSEKKIVLLLTSAIDVKGIKFSVINSTDERYAEYHSALIQWSRCPSIKSIIFCDNSNYDLSEFKMSVKDLGDSEKFEFYSYEGQEFSRELGKGYGEITTFEYVWSHSKAFNNADIILKVNGRYFIENINEVIHKLICCDSFVIGDFRKNLTWMDSRIFAFQPVFFEKYFLPFKEKINDSEGLMFEMALARSVHQAMSDGFDWEMMPAVPVIKGKSGSTGRVYSRFGIRRLIKLFYLKLCRYILRR